MKTDRTTVPFYFFRGDKSTSAIYGASFSDLEALEAAQRNKKRDEKEFGRIYGPDEKRPAEGAFEIVTEEDVEEMLDVPISLGLRIFENMIPVDFSVKPMDISENPFYVEQLPVISEMLFRSPKNDKDMVSMVMRIIVTDPQFVDKNGKPLRDKLPPEYAQAVLNSLHPFMTYKAAAGELGDMLKRAGSLEEPYKQILVRNAKKWQGKEPSKDPNVLRQYAKFIILHEMTHAGGLHLPDKVLSSLSAEEQERLKQFSYERYLDLLSEDADLQGSVVFSKNLIKALLSVKKETPSERTQEAINRILALEMLCDRFSMFLYEQSRKLQVYQAVFGERFGDPMPLQVMYRLEEERKAGQLKQKYSEFGAGVIAKLEKDVEAVEKEHVYIAFSGDPVITPAERTFFKNFLDLLRHFDKEKKILRFTQEHANSSRLIDVSTSGLTTKAGAGFTTVAVS